jgi:monoamine oxidase
LRHLSPRSSFRRLRPNKEGALASEQNQFRESPIPAAATPVPSELRRIALDGLESNRGERKRVIVLGAGIAGLAAAYELARAGHEPVVLEAQNRVGGRIHTLRTFAPGLYAEAGAMRIPRIHDLTLEYCRQFGLELRPFLMDCDRAPVYLAGRRMTPAEFQLPENMPFDLAEHERGQTYEELWREATREVHELYEREGGDRARELIGERYDRYSIRAFLKERGFSEGAIELYGIMSFREANMNVSIVELLREVVGRAFEDMQEIVGGCDLLPRAFYERIKSHVHLGAQAVSVDQHDDGVTVNCRTAAGIVSEDGDYCICTLPFGVLRHLDFRPGLSKGKYRAIRGLNYNPSTKILIQVRHRFWEDEGIFGGATPTDLPVRRIVYPSHPIPGEERGVLLASYTWGQDAARWSALGENERIELALKDIAKIHPQILNEFEGGASYAWQDDPHAVGAFALFEPGQETAMHADIVKPEGRVHFAGEHCSLWHAWIQGSLESGIRAAQEIHGQPVAATA